MRPLLLVLLAMVAAVAASQLFAEDPGRLVAYWGGWVVESSLAFAFAATLLLVFMVWLLLRLATATLMLPSRLAAWRRHRRSAVAHRALTHGFIDEAEGRWERAERGFLRAAEEGRLAFAGHISAARAAQRRGAYGRRDEYLRAALADDPKAESAVAFVQAGFQLESGHGEVASAVLERLEEMVGTAPHLLRLKALLAERANDDDTLLRLVPELRRKRVLDGIEIDRLEREAALRRLVGEGGTGRQAAEEIAALEQRLSGDLADDPAIVAALARAYHRVGEPERAADLLRASLHRGYEDETISVFGRVPHRDPAVALAWAERFLTGRERNPVLLLALGRLADAAKLWGKAHSYIEASIGLSPAADACLDLAELYERTGRTKEACDCYRRGLVIAVGETVSSLDRQG